MGIQIANNELANCSSINQVVELVNDGDRELVAAAYAIGCCKDAGYGFGEDDLCAHLHILEEEGAEFVFSEALDLAIKNHE